MTIWRDEAREQAKRLFAEVFGYPCPICGKRYMQLRFMRQHRLRGGACYLYRRVRRATCPASTTPQP